MPLEDAAEPYVLNSYMPVTGISDADIGKCHISIALVGSGARKGAFIFDEILSKVIGM